MNDRDALFAAILAHPDEDTPRLAFADWLEEHGDPGYAAFIRKQIELAQVPEWDPLWIRTWNRERTTASGYLYDQLAPKLPDGLKGSSLGFRQFRRGFPWHVESTGPEPFLKHADELFAAFPLQALTIHATQRWRDPIDLTALFASPHLARLKSFSITLARLTAETIRQMQACPYLRNVSTVVTNFAGFLPGSLPALLRPPLIEQLDSLCLQTSSVAWQDVAAGLADAGGPHRLRSFVVTESSSARFSMSKAFDAPVLRGLKEFEITGYEMGESNFRALCAAPVLNGLESLTLNKTKPGVPGVKVLAECPALRGLKRLRLGSNHIGPVAVKALARSPHLSGLQVLDLHNNPLGDKGAVALAEAPWMANLIGLELMHCDVGDTGAEALLDALPAGQLVHLYISSGTNLSDRVRQKIAAKFGA